MENHSLFENKTCIEGCCSYITSDFTFCKNKSRRVSNKKAGAFIYDDKSKKILLVQSRGNLWGVPKGTFETDENCISCTIREVEEETGIRIPESFFDNLDKQSCLNIYGNGYYYYYPMTMTDVQPQMTLDNDVNAIGWFKLKCLREMVVLEKIKLNIPAKKCLKHFLGLIFL